jgi:hypothetical protein
MRGVGAYWAHNKSSNRAKCLMALRSSCVGGDKRISVRSLLVVDEHAFYLDQASFFETF